MKIIAFIGSGLLILFGALMAIGATDPYNGQIVWLPIGLVMILAGLVIIFFAARKKPTDASNTTNVTLKVDLPGNTSMDAMKCKSCGGVLSAENISMVQGAPMVTCPFCKTVYQLTEDPKW